MATYPRAVLLLLILSSFLLQGGCSREPGIHLDLEITGIHLMQGGPLLLNLDYHWRRDPGFVLDFDKPNVYVHFLNEDKEIFLQDDHQPPAELLSGDVEGREIHYQRCGVLLTTEPVLYDNLERSQVEIRSGFCEKMEMTKKLRVLERRMKLATEFSLLPSITTLEEPEAQADEEHLIESLARLLPSATIKGAGSAEPIAVRLIPQEQLALIRENFSSQTGSLGIEMPAGSSAEFVLRPSRGSQVSFTPLARSKTLFRVRMIEQDGSEQTLWERLVSGDGAEISLPLPVKGDEVVGLWLECDGPDSGIWADARLVEPLSPIPVDRALEGTVAEIRDAAREWNIILVILDATRADALSCYGNSQRLTPTLDRIARSGVQFIESHSPASYTIASTASLFSGLYPTTHRVLDWQDRLWGGFPVLAEALSEAGKTTALITANPCISGHYGLDRGFDHFIVVPKVRDKRMDAATVNSCLDQLMPTLADSGVSSYYLYLHYLEPHMPYDPPEPIRGLVTRGSSVADLMADRETIRDPEYTEGQERDEQVAHYRALYHGNLMHVDFELGKALARLRRQGLLDRTLLVITSDHGEAFLEHGRMLHGSTVYREEVAVPLLVRFPPPLNGLSGLRNHRVSTVDTTAFLSQLFGLSGSDLADSLEGTSYLSAIMGSDCRTVDEAFLLAALDQQHSIGMFDEKHSLVMGLRGIEMFDRVTDPYQLLPVLEAEPMVRSYFHQRTLAHLSRVSWQDPGLEGSTSATIDQELKDQLVALGYAGE